MTDRLLLLVRHGVTDWNREGRFQGHRDARLAADGRIEARLLGARLAAEAPAGIEIVTSPLSRAAETASLVAEAFAADRRPAVRDEARLIEIGQGEWEGRTHQELAATDADRYATWRRLAGEQQPPGAESIEAALARVADAITEIVAAPATCVLVVSHGGILRLAARHLLGLGARRAWAMDVDNASLSVLARAAGSAAWRIERWNDTAHLLGRTPQHVDEAEGEPLAL